MKKNFAAILLLCMIQFTFAQEEIKLYPKDPKESNGITTPEKYRDPEFLMNISDARMYAYPAPKEIANGTAVVICPGGGYVGISQIKEGSEIAKWFNELGVTAFVLYYRMPNGHPNAPIEDAQTALKIVKKGAKKWNLNINKIGIMGFSAGGHLASTIGTHFKNKMQRPDFMILAYPVVTMQKNLTHMGSHDNFLGKDATKEMEDLYSNELQVKKNAPPTFIVQAKDDKAVPIANSEHLYKALQEKHISSELHEFEVGGHGFGMRSRGIPVDHWPDLLKEWLKKQNLISNK